MATQTIIGNLPMTHGNHKSIGSATQSTLYLNRDIVRQPEYTVYLHSISRRSFMQPHSIYNNVAIPACPKDKRSYCFFKVQHPVNLPSVNPHDVNGEPAWTFENAKKVALSICNPNYAGTDLAIQDKELNPETIIASGECNLTRQGIFASMNEIPTEEELKKAEARREAYYRVCLQDADKISKSRPDKMHELLNEDHRLAADYFAIETSWRLQPTAKIDCPNCGSKIPQTAAFHYDNGRICILDWEKAWLAGAVKKDDVPEPKRWWGEPLAKGFASSGDIWSKEKLQQVARDRGIDVDLRWSYETLSEKIREVGEGKV